ncbi:putative spermidine/putrescine transport system ATP-binding protein [Aminobacter aminovorans]|uniref:Spermidine/putrescine import ATP-binding protein PotA n=1 Tax=Aminobacter aminovorans TaxID=83263 RepID=A0A381IJX1_AMIAI|nr:ABC transporter ATP-binding protein [Aminobacter aminovorans]TCS25078.1 putative spermidine/putrescine transport system ATP-binding protein [Aminobacter aminovorans]SUY28413.1 sn-glycerol-3-phosphate import ATP-binding protein UgpC [Aminobacter aminovorans]
MASLAEEIIQFHGVEKTYDGHTKVVDSLDLCIERGSFLSLLGPSGSGKTTTLMMLAGFEGPTSGDIRMHGRSLLDVPPYRRGMGVVFQNYALFPHLSVAQNIAFPLQQRRVGKSDVAIQVRRALEMVNLPNIGARYPRQLSGGQQQRVALARALVFEPEVVLMDEPLGALDKQLREHMQIEIKRLHQRLGITIVYVTHDQGEALTMSSRVAVFHEGKIQQIAVPEDIYERPGTSFVANFIGENNRLDGVVDHGVDGDFVVLLGNGTRLTASADTPLAAGSKTTLSIRPERISINPGSSVRNVVPATVRELIYLGDHVRVRMSVCGNHDFFAKLPIGNVDSSLRPELEILVGWKAEHCRALDPMH